MPDPTPGEIAYWAFWQAFAAACGADIDAWDTIHPGTQAAWEAAAQAVRDAADFPPLDLSLQETPRMPAPTLPRVGSVAFAALMADALRCDCDTAAAPLCVRCACLFSLAVAAVDYEYARTGRRGPQETPMPDPTPGQVAYEAYWRTFAPQFGPLYMHPWASVSPQNQTAWEAAAQAVRDQQDFPPMDLDTRAEETLPSTTAP